MTSLNVLVSTPLFAETVPRIARVDPRINVAFIGDLLKAEGESDETARATLDHMLGEAEVVAGMRLPHNLLQRAPRLKWIQATSAGVDHLLSEELRISPVILTNAANLHSFAPTEFAMTACFTRAKNVRECYRQKETRAWEPYNTVILRHKTMGIVGYGHIGKRIARVAKALEMRVIATRRTVTEPRSARYADVLLPASENDRLMEESDFVVLALPMTSGTRHLIGAQELRRMKRNAFLVNISRGPIVDEGALAHALKEGAIAGAAMDVFEVEPLPEDSPLWDAPNFMYSPHIAGWLTEYPEMVLEVFMDHLRRYLSGQRLRCVINKDIGY
ncbi:MAG: D-2-hydroxyacid dehydrogenase [Chloroflexota bacterium]